MKKFETNPRNPLFPLNKNIFSWLGSYFHAFC